MPDPNKPPVYICIDEASEMTPEVWEAITKGMKMVNSTANRFNHISIDQARTLVGRRIIDVGNNNLLVKSISIRNGIIYFNTNLNIMTSNDVNWDATDKLHSTLMSELEAGEEDNHE